MKKGQGRNHLGQFAPSPKKKRWIEISDEVWEILGDRATNREKTRSELIEELIRNGIVEMH